MVELGGRTVTSTVNAPHDGSNLGETILTYMRTHGVDTHGEMGAVLGIDRTLVSKYVSGARQCHDVTQLRSFARALDVPLSTFGLVDAPDSADAGAALSSDDNERWKAVRRTLNRNRHALSKVAADLYWDPLRIEGTTCLTAPGWMPDTPVELRSIELSWVTENARAVVNGRDDEAAAYRAEGPDGQPYNRYSQAVRALAKPNLFENRGSYRLLDLAWDSAGGQMRFGYTTYFDMIDVCEVMAHELAGAWMDRGEGEKLQLEDLPFRQHVGDLFDLQRRTVLPSINTLTIRKAPEGCSRC